MLDYGMRRVGGGAVEWRLGTSERIDTNWADLVIMSANVAMHIIGDEWYSTLTDVARGLRVGGVLAFESRNPAAEAWRRWNEQLSERQTVVGRLRESTITTPPDSQGVTTMYCHNYFVDAGGILDVKQRLQFRAGAQLIADVEGAGLTLESVWCDWRRTPFTGRSDEQLIVIEATRGDR